MDVAYNQHSHHSKRSNRSSTNLNHLSLAPLTSRLPLNDAEALPDTHTIRTPHEHRTSYIEGRSAPTTPRLLSRSNSRVSLKKSQGNGLSKSKSSTHITLPSKSGSTTPNKARLRAEKDGLTLSSLSVKDKNDSDWLLRAGATITSEARESKGQTWLVSRASSTSLTGQRDEDEEALEKELARERESRRNSMSRRGSGAGADADDEYSPLATRLSFGGGSRSASRYGSRAGSRAHSRRGSRVLFTPLIGNDKEREGYFDAGEDFVAAPDFVDVDDEVYDENEAAQDEVIVRRLAKKGTTGLGTWVEKWIGWNLFAVEEDDGEESDNETTEPTTDGSETGRSTAQRRKETLAFPAEIEKLPPPGDEVDGWKDAAWLLSVATKVLL